MGKFRLSDVGAVFTNCLFPEFTHRAISSLLGFYPDLSIVVVDDHCRNHERDLKMIETDFSTSVLRNKERIGAGRSIDRGLRQLTQPLLLTVEHGVELLQPGLIEQYLVQMEEPSVFGVGEKRRNNECARALGPFVDPLFALWDREFIVAHAELTFALTAIRTRNWRVKGCTTAQFLCYRAMRLGGTLSFLDGKLSRYLVHHRTPRDRGLCASPHEVMNVKEDFLSPRIDAPNGSTRSRRK